MNALDGLLLFAACALIAVFTQGCVRSAELWKGGPRIEFLEGLDVHGGMNGIDKVDDRRGVTGKHYKTDDKAY